MTLLTGLATLALVAAPPPAPGPDPQAVAWLRAHATPAGDPSAEPAAAEAAAIDRLTDGARIVGFGEATHMTREPLVQRNRLIRYLVQHRGVRIVALESGLAQGRRVHDWVAGGPGDLASVTAKGLTWGFGTLEENAELLTWLRTWNAEHPSGRVAFYGYDITGGDTQDGLGGAPLALSEVLEFLARAAPARSQAVRAALAPRVDAFTNDGWAKLTPAERQALRDGLAAARKLLADHRAELVAATSVEDYDWTREEALDCERLAAVFAIWPDFPTQWPKAFAVSRIRDGAMAEHVGWILGREGPTARMLLFAANGHVSASPLLWPDWATMKVDMPSVGQHLRERFGAGYRTLITLPTLDPASGGEPPPPESLNAQFAAAQTPPSWTDFRGAQAVGAWSAGVKIAVPGYVLPGRPRHAFDMVSTRTDAIDGVLFLGRLTPETPKP